MKDPGKKVVQFRVGLSDAMRDELVTRFENASQHIRNLIAEDLRKRKPLVDIWNQPREKVPCNDGWKE